MQYLLVFIGSGVGGLLRFALIKVQNYLELSFPMANLACNFIGSIAIIFAFAFIKDKNLNVLFITGFLGGFTTYSAFALDLSTVQYPALYIIANLLIMCISMVAFKLIV